MSGSEQGLDLVTPEEVEAQRALLEAVGDAFGTDDDVLKALLSNQMLIAQQLGVTPGEPPDGGDGDGLPPSMTELPVGSLGVALEGLEPSSTGPAMFYPGGSRVEISVEATDEIDPFDIVRITARNGTIEVEEAEKGQAMFNGVVVDETSTTRTLDDGESTTLEVDTIGADDLVMLVDDGTLGNQPAQYDLEQHVYVDEFDDYQFYDRISGIQLRSVEDTAFPPKMREVIENTSGTDDQDYRVALLAVRRGG